MIDDLVEKLRPTIEQYERNADHLVELLEAVFGAVVDTRLS
jgi:hypothetical protein